jgi:hypothetical protein
MLSVKQEAAMKIHVFAGPSRVFGFTEDATGDSLPASHGPWMPFKEIRMKRGDKPRISANIDEALDDIEDHGYHLVQIAVIKTAKAP